MKSFIYLRGFVDRVNGVIALHPDMEEIENNLGIHPMSQYVTTEYMAGVRDSDKRLKELVNKK